MVKRKRVLLIFACLAAVLLAGYVTLRLTAPKHINEDFFKAIHKGMNEKEVVAILGAGPGVYSSKGMTGSYLTSQDWMLTIETGFQLIKGGGVRSGWPRKVAFLFVSMIKAEWKKLFWVQSITRRNPSSPNSAAGWACESGPL